MCEEAILNVIFYIFFCEMKQASYISPEKAVNDVSFTWNWDLWSIILIPMLPAVAYHAMFFCANP